MNDVRDTCREQKKKRGVENGVDLLSLSIIFWCDGHHGESLGVSVSRKKKKMRAVAEVVSVRRHQREHGKLTNWRDIL